LSLHFYAGRSPSPSPSPSPSLTEMYACTEQKLYQKHTETEMEMEMEDGDGDAERLVLFLHCSPPSFIDQGNRGGKCSI
jgi:hypothetical protein